MTDTQFAIRVCHMAPPHGLPIWVADGTYVRTNVRTQQTNASKTQDHHLAFLTVRVGLWITRISRQGVTK